MRGQIVEILQGLGTDPLYGTVCEEDVKRGADEIMALCPSPGGPVRAALEEARDTLLDIAKDVSACSWLNHPDENGGIFQRIDAALSVSTPTGEGEERLRAAPGRSLIAERLMVAFPEITREQAECAAETAFPDCLNLAHPKQGGQRNGWKPIETAPKDGTWVLLRGGDVEYRWDGDTKPPGVVAQFVGDHWQFAWYDGGYMGEYEAPAEWMPLPATPTPPCLGEREAVARTQSVENLLIRLDDAICARENYFGGTTVKTGDEVMADVKEAKDRIREHIEPLRTENETLRAEVARLTDIALGDDAKAIAEYEWERANKLVAERDAAIARAEEAERRLGQRPLTASDLAEALECFSNPVVSAMHSGTATECCIAQGMDAVARRLREMDRLAALTTPEHPHGD